MQKRGSTFQTKKTLSARPERTERCITFRKLHIQESIIGEVIGLRARGKQEIPAYDVKNLDINPIESHFPYLFDQEIFLLSTEEISMMIHDMDKEQQCLIKD